MGRIGIGIALALAAAAASAQTYRWVDRDGKVNFTDTPPPAFARDVQKRARDPGPPDTLQGSYDLQQAQKRFPVVLYTTPDGCQPCKDARDLLTKRGVPFREVVVGSNETREDLKKVSSEMEVPVLTVGKDVHRGFETGMYNSALDTAGYPKTALPGAVQQAAAKPAAKPQPAPEPKPVVDEPPRGRYTPIAPDDAPPIDAAKGRYLPQ
jgi:glutaredoxin